MRSLTFALSALPALREATGASDCDLAAAAILAELAGVDAVRLGISEEQRPVRESDVMALRRSARRFELRMPACPTLQKIALEARPDQVVLCGPVREPAGIASPLDPRSQSNALVPLLRTLEDAGIEALLLVPPALDAVKAAHGLGARGVELFAGAIVDLPASERPAELERLGDAARLASKLRLPIGVSGGLGFRNLEEVLEAAPAAGRVVVGRSLTSRALLVGIDRAVRDIQALVRRG